MNPFLRKTTRLWLVGMVVCAWNGAQAGSVNNAGVTQFHTDIQPLLHTYCYECHGDGEANGEVAFDELKSPDDILNKDLWTKVMKNLRAGIMPPLKAPRPTAEEQKKIEDWVKYQAYGIDLKNLDPGRVTLRRLNRVEYRNTIRDLMGVDFNTDVEFPPDDTGYGFDDIGDVLTISPMLLEKYMIAATAIVEDAVPKVAKVMPQSTIAGSRFHPPGTNSGGGRGGNNQRDSQLGLSYYKPATVTASYTAQTAGNYRLALELSAHGNFEYDPGKCHVIFLVDGKEMLGTNFSWENNKTFRPFNFDENWQAGSHKFSLELQPLTSTNDQLYPLELRINSVTIQGPMDEKYWSKPKNYDRFFTKEAPKDPAGRRQAAREALARFTEKAFRRPVDAKTLDRLVPLAESVYEQPGKTFEAGVGHAMVAVLASPRFLFRTEGGEKPLSKDDYPLVDEYSLASRLSYFLWSSMPDDELFGLAARGELRKNLPAQVKRMLADSRSEAFVRNFTGQWLQARDVEGISIDARVVEARDKGDEKKLKQQMADLQARLALKVVGGGEAALTNASAGTNATTGTNNLAKNTKGNQRRGFNFTKPAIELDGDLRHAMERETEMCFSTVVHDDRSVLELIDSDYTFLNQKLATAYGLTNLGVTGTDMRRVTLPPDCPRGGVLTEGTVLVVTSNPDRTSPVKRGLFVLNNILGSPTPPPPPNIPSLEASEKTFHDHEPTLRETLAAHREKPECASCHSRLDPVGLAFENFNALGLWRDFERNQLIEPAGKLVTGEKFESVAELKHILATKHRREFYECLTGKVLTYATGRGMEYYDTETVDEIVQRLEASGGKFSELLTGVIESAPFQKERRVANATYSNASEPAKKSNVGAANSRKSAP